MSSLVTPARGKYTLPGLLTVTSWPASSRIIFWLATLALRRAAPQDLGEVVADRLLELRVGARARLTVRAPADELGGVPEARPLHVVVADLEHALRPQRDERQVLVRVPPAGHGRPRGTLAGLVLRPVPRVLVEGGDQRLQLAEQLDARVHRERADHADAGQLPVVFVQAEQQGPDAVLPALVDPVAGHHAVRGALVLDLLHDPLVRLVYPPRRLGDQPVQARALELAEPPGGHLPVAGGRSQVDGRRAGAGRGDGIFERRPSLDERAAPVVDITECE